MMNKQQMLILAKRRIEQNRTEAVDRCEKNLATLRMHDDWNSCERSLKTAQVQWILKRDQSAEQTVQRQKAQRQELLKKYGFSEKDLVPNYSCKMCSDTGYVDGQPCQCLQSEIRKLLVAESNVADHTMTFANSKETNKHNLAVHKKAIEVCKNGKLKNVLLTGGTGTGKTYLLSACINLCAEEGKSVLFTTAYNLNSLFLECHLSDVATKRAILDNLTDVDVLAIDDLGTENVYKNVTAEYLFALVNERLTRGKQTFFSTNLSLSDVRERYDERIFSRLVDQDSTFIAMLEGNDKRLQK